MGVKVLVVPEPGKMREIAKRLMELADDQRQVEYVSYPAAGFLVPQEVFELLEADAPAEGDSGSETPKRRGRPRKNQESGEG